ncbi:hypothetical protein JRQ81_007212 [Phrynocephalus forsythii]|uniref:t-SNARE coiled-coil homology domain-containing protein n=1 Tax=Phrynocephalus forsythii TaxID=171643 RepID=A0A9Q0XDB1_9SAUR|nr:hypothetical protein JRQ81_007212 [Phrynocephalus forsythii]
MTACWPPHLSWNGFKDLLAGHSCSLPCASVATGMSFLVLDQLVPHRLQGEKPLPLTQKLLNSPQNPRKSRWVCPARLLVCRCVQHREEPTMKDRLEELKNRVNEKRDSWELDDALSFDNPVFQEDEGSAMDKVFQEIGALSSSLEKLEELSEEVDRKQHQVLCCTTEESICEEKKELCRIKEAFTKDARALQPKFDGIHTSLAQDHRQGQALHRIRRSQLSVLVNRYREIVSRHYTKETHYVEKLKEQIRRQTELAGLHLQEEDLKRLVESPVAPRIVGQDLDVLKAKQHLALAQVRHQQLLDLEAQIRELHSLFLHMEVLVAEQGESIDSIEYNVLHTLDYISQSNEEVKKALKYERQSRFSAAVSALLGLCACCTCLSCMATPSVVR